MASTDNLHHSLPPRLGASAGATAAGGTRTRRGRLLLGVNVFLVLCAGAIALSSWVRGWHSASVAPLRLSEARLVQRRASPAVVEALVARAAEQLDAARVREQAQATRAGTECGRGHPLQAGQQRRDCLGWKAGNEAAVATRAAWQQLASLRAAAQEAAAGAAADWAWAAANSKPGALTQAVARRLLGLMKQRQVTREAVCNAVLASPKIALLFLTRGELPHHRLWQQWLAAVVGRVPRRRAAAFGCTPAHVELLKQACGMWNASIVNPHANQHLFSIYIHSPPNYTPDYAHDSIFYGHTLPCRITPEWGSHDLVEAQRLLYRAALEDPLNQRFLMVSEADVPLYPAALVWAQLVSEGRSRVDACTTDRAATNFDARASPQLFGSALLPDSWRKSSQWSVLTRAHAELVVADQEVNALFARHCYQGDDPHLGWWRTCPSDEHYVPTLLAHLNRSEECDCALDKDAQGSHMYVEWTPESVMSGHPRVFGASDVSPQLLHRMRRETYGGHTKRCSDDDIVGAVRSFVDAFADADRWTDASCKAVAEAGAMLRQGPALENTTSLPEDWWVCPGSTHWSPAGDGRCCTADESRCDVGAVQQAPPSESRRLDLAVGAGFSPLPPGLCFLMARKFGPDAADPLLELAKHCDRDELPILGFRHCPDKQVGGGQRGGAQGKTPVAAAVAAGAGGGGGEESRAAKLARAVETLLRAQRDARRVEAERQKQQQQQQEGKNR